MGWNRILKLFTVVSLSKTGAGRITGLLLFVFISIVSPAQKIRYDFHDCSISADEQSRIQTVATYENAFFSDVFGTKSEPKLHIRMYADSTDFNRAQFLSVFHIISETGVYNPFYNHIIVLKWSRFIATTYHECSHAIYHHYCLLHPVWLDEGLAEYFKTATVDSAGQVTIHENAYRKSMMKKYVADSAFSLEKMLTVRQRRFHGKQHNYFYTMGWAVVYFLRTQHDDIFKKILRKSKSRRKCKRAIELEYPGGIVQLENDLRKFYR